MITRYVDPSVARGSVVAPPSKSYTHRALMAGFLSGRRYGVRDPLVADDTRATAAGLEMMGLRIVREKRRWILGPREGSTGARGPGIVDCGASGTTLRFLSVIAATLDQPVTFTGEEGLAGRPMAGLFRALRAGGVKLDLPERGRSLPFTVRGPMSPLRASVDTRTSSQFLSALLMVLPTLDGPSTLSFTGTPVSWTYVEATLAVMRAHGVRVKTMGSRVSIPGGQAYQGGSFQVPGDASSAAYAWAAAALTGGRVRVRGLDPAWPQADLAILPALSRMGARVERHRDGATVKGRDLMGTTLDLTASPDLYPLMGVVGAFAKGTTKLTGAAHVIHKESDRKQNTLLLAGAFGARARKGRGGVEVVGSPPPHAAELLTIDDHRVMMSAAAGAMAARGRSTLADSECVRKSFPDFWGWMGSIGMHTGVTS